MTPDCMSGETRYLNEVLLNSMIDVLGRTVLCCSTRGFVVSSLPSCRQLQSPRGIWQSSFVTKCVTYALASRPSRTMCTSSCQAARALKRTKSLSGCASQLNAANGASLDCLVFIEALTVCQAGE